MYKVIEVNNKIFIASPNCVIWFYYLRTFSTSRRDRGDAKDGDDPRRTLKKINEKKIM